MSTLLEKTNEKEDGDILTNLGKTKETIIYELLLSLNQGNVSYLTNQNGYEPRINMAIGQYEALVEKGIVREI